MTLRPLQSFVPIAAAVLVLSCATGCVRYGHGDTNTVKETRVAGTRRVELGVVRDVRDSQEANVLVVDRRMCRTVERSVTTERRILVETNPTGDYRASWWVGGIVGLPSLLLGLALTTRSDESSQETGTVIATAGGVALGSALVFAAATRIAVALNPDPRKSEVPGWRHEEPAARWKDEPSACGDDDEAPPSSSRVEVIASLRGASYERRWQVEPDARGRVSMSEIRSRATKLASWCGVLDVSIRAVATDEQGQSEPAANSTAIYSGSSVRFTVEPPSKISTLAELTSGDAQLGSIARSCCAANVRASYEESCVNDCRSAMALDGCYRAAATCERDAEQRASTRDLVGMCRDLLGRCARSHGTSVEAVDRCTTECQRERQAAMCGTEDMRPLARPDRSRRAIDIAQVPPPDIGDAWSRSSPMMATPPIESNATSPSGGSPSWRPIVGWSALGAGVAASIVGSIAGVNALSEKSAFESQCIGSTCSTAARQTLDSADASATISTISFTSAAALAGFGTYLLLVPPSQSSR